MKYIDVSILVAFVISFAYILNMNRKAAVKRKAFRWCVGLCGLYVLISMASTADEIVLMVFAAPVIAWLVFGVLRSIKFCEWCGKAVNTSRPFLADKKHCPRCGSDIS